MRIICPTCASHYEVEREKIAAQGQLVRCARCREVWLVRCLDEQAVAAEPASIPHEPVPGFEPIRRPTAAVTIPASEVVDFQAARIRLRPRERGAASGHGRATSLSLLAGGAVVLATLLSLYGFRGDVAGRLPGAARALAALGVSTPAPLALRDVHSVVVAEGADSVLTLEGKIANVGTGPESVPGITVVVRSANQAPLYTWTTAPPKSTLASGETIDFKARLDSPPRDARDVRVSFAPFGDTAMAQLDN